MSCAVISRVYVMPCHPCMLLYHPYACHACMLHYHQSALELQQSATPSQKSLNMYYHRLPPPLPFLLARTGIGSISYSLSLFSLHTHTLAHCTQALAHALALATNGNRLTAAGRRRDRGQASDFDVSVRHPPQRPGQHHHPRPARAERYRRGAARRGATLNVCLAQYSRSRNPCLPMLLSSQVPETPADIPSLLVHSSSQPPAAVRQFPSVSM